MFIRFFSPACAFLATLLLWASLNPASASVSGIPISLKIDPATLREGSDRRTTVQVLVTLQAPAQGYFICEVRSPDRRKVDCGSIIFKKGDTVGKGAGTVYWSSITADTMLKISAFNVDAPDTLVSFTLTLRKKDGESP